MIQAYGGLPLRQPLSLFFVVNKKGARGRLPLWFPLLYYLVRALRADIASPRMPTPNIKIVAGSGTE